MSREYEVESFDHLGLRVSIQQDDSSTSDPRGWDNLGHMICWHPHYKLGDEQFSGPEDVGGSRTMQDVSRWLFRERKATVMLPLYLLDHSGITMSAGAPIYRHSPKDKAVRAAGRFMGDDAGWDTSMVGFIYATKEAEAETPDVVKYLRGEVETYDDFLTGNVYGYVVEDRDGEVLDSCWGFFPNHPETGYEEPWAEAASEARSAAEAEATSRAVAP
jgi:hypothetical protein